MDVGSQRERSSSISTKMCSSNRLKQKGKNPAAAARKVQVVYYLSRNGLLEHPHFMELTLFPNQPLRLKDVCDRLKALRGSGMPLQYSWSSKRNYKSGYVWHDLALKDIIHPAGGEYVLKGSELVQGCSERFQLLNVMSNKQAAAVHLQMPEPNCSDDCNNHYSKHNKKAFNPAPQEYEYEEREKRSSYKNTSSTTTPHSRCSRGVSTEDLDEEEDDNTNTKKVVIHTSTTNDLAEKVAKSNQGWVLTGNNNNTKQVIIGDELAASALSSTESRRRSRHWVLLQLISCGSSANLKLNSKASKEEAQLSSKKAFPEDLRRLQYCEEKEYFSGSIVDSMKALEAEPPVLLLNRSNSYDEQHRLVMEKQASELARDMEVKQLQATEQDKTNRPASKEGIN